jgi:Tfp pilus assembly protein PilW
VLRAPLPRITPNDFNGDAKSDLVWRASTGTNAMWLGAVNTTTQAIATNPSEWKLVGQGDFDADGKSDLVWRNTSTGANTIWRAGNTNTRIAVPTLTSATSMATANPTCSGATRVPVRSRCGIRPAPARV